MFNINDSDYNAVLALQKVLDTKFAQDVILLDLRELTPVADYFVIATGTSTPQLAALSDAAEEVLIAHGLKLGHREGVNSSSWTLLDFGAVVVHIFDKVSREYYNLERTWADAKIITPTT